MMYLNRCILFLCHYSLKSKLFYGISDKKPYLYEVIKFRASISQRLLPVFLLPIY